MSGSRHCGVCAECKTGQDCTAMFRLKATEPDEGAARIMAALGFIDRMRGVDANVDAVLSRVALLLTTSAADA